MSIKAYSFYVISYDVVEDRKRYKIAKLLEGKGTRVQKSVFECYLTEKELIKLNKEIMKKINPETDSVRIYLLCKRCKAAISVLGNGVPQELSEYDIL
ncbi:CRISPR-associated protein Cas2 [Thermodesulfobium narugense DSM 14796]|uniref:CRISPR-associated endoribonuclease Cas2 n=1 Tax=Thermodesulfobium narugense DSM 14796 TaxID=747365 RepID=M1E8T4_9BACT|nr:CRISPR-associated endonuclease Cas2 [Thermodesulfobium narugense]AEE15333.1 CRISPR-associated protein Cas2 [Thermodesulfobium narugense DSM 14796]